MFDINNGLVLALVGAISSALFAGLAWLLRSLFGRSAARLRNRQLVATAFDGPIYALQNLRTNLSGISRQGKTTDEIDYLNVAIRNFPHFEFHPDLRRWIIASEFHKDEEQEMMDIIGHIEGSTNYFRLKIEMLVMNITPAVAGFKDPGIAGIFTRFFMYERSVPDSPVVSVVEGYRDEIKVYIEALRAMQSAISTHRGTGRIQESAALPFPDLEAIGTA